MSDPRRPEIGDLVLLYNGLGVEIPCIFLDYQQSHEWEGNDYRYVIWNCTRDELTHFYDQWPPPFKVLSRLNESEDGNA